MCGSRYSQALLVATLTGYDTVTCIAYVGVEDSGYIVSNEGEAVLHLADLTGRIRVIMIRYLLFYFVRYSATPDASEY